MYTEILTKDWLDRDGKTFVHKRSSRRIGWENERKDKSSYSSWLLKEEANTEEALKKAYPLAQNIIRSLGFPRTPRIVMSPKEISYTDGSAITVSTKVFDEKEMPSGKKLDIFLGYTVHEASHLLYTDFGYAKKNSPDRLTHQIANLIEDERIEKELGEQYPGFANYLESTKEYSFSNFYKKIEAESSMKESGPKARFFEILNCFLCLVRYPAGLSEELIEKNGKWLLQMRDVLTPYPATTEESYKAAGKILDILKEFIKEDDKQDGGESSSSSSDSSKENNGSEKEQQEKNSGEDSGEDKDGKSGKNPDSEEDKDSEENTPSGENPEGNGEESPEESPSEEENGSGDGDTEKESESSEEKNNESSEEKDGEDSGKSEGGSEKDNEGDGDGDSEGEKDGSSRSSESGEEDSSSGEDKAGDESPADDEKAQELLREMMESLSGAMKELSPSVESGHLDESEVAGILREHAQLEQDIITGKAVRGTQKETIILKPKDEESLAKYYYLEDYRDVKKYVPAIRQILKRHFKEYSYDQHAFRSGKLETRKLAGAFMGDKNVYVRKGEVFTDKIAVGLLVDESGSMFGERIEAARKTAILLREAFSGIREVELFIYGHTADYMHGYEEKATILKTFLICYQENKKGNPYALGNVSAKHNNKDGIAILETVRQIKAKSDKPLILFVISDGTPMAYGYDGIAAREDTRDKVLEAEKLGATIIQICINPSYNPAEMFKNYIIMDDLGNLPKQLTGAVSDAVRKNTARKDTVA